MAEKLSHQVLTKAQDFNSASHNVLNFFDKTMLLQYDTIEVQPQNSFQATTEEFWRNMQTAIDKNQHKLDGFISELKESGCQTIHELSSVTQGYQSKLVHIISHLLDGFVGIDTYFYNLLEDSHWLSDPLKETIIADKHSYWLIKVEASFQTAAAASIFHD